MKKSLGTELRDNCAALVQRWYERWRESPHPSAQVPAVDLKNSLAAQLKLIGEQLCDLRAAARPEEIWRVPERLDPELRVDQQMPVEEVVQEYELAIDVVRTWIEEREIPVSFSEYSYFFRTMFELTAEAVRRYAKYQAEVVREERARYLASVMHQLRTPLSALSVQVELLGRGEHHPGTAAISNLQRNVRRLTVLVDGILRLERFRPWEVPVRSEEVTPAHLIDGIVTDHEAEAARKGLRFEAHVNRSLRMTLDANLFLDAIGNIVHNAVKYTTHGFVIIDAAEEEDSVVFCVRDSGPGMAREKQRTLFEHAQPGSVGGAGIGLQIAQHAARAQGGCVEVQSEMGKGSLFSLRLPRVVPNRGAREDQHATE